jgi:adenosyl cobinamide kinase/adenosyl cobinamide phosphate guanylyltransferase
MLTFLIGGARSGKSRIAESLCLNSPRVAYIATARANDEEMRARIARHRHDRPLHWDTFEEPLAMAPLLRKIRQECDALLLDCLTVWLSNSLYRFRRQTPNHIEDRVSITELLCGTVKLSKGLTEVLCVLRCAGERTISV